MRLSVGRWKNSRCSFWGKFWVGHPRSFAARFTRPGVLLLDLRSKLRNRAKTSPKTYTLQGNPPAALANGTPTVGMDQERDTKRPNAHGIRPLRFDGASDRARTGDPRFTRAVLCQLSYAGDSMAETGKPVPTIVYSTWKFSSAQVPNAPAKKYLLPDTGAHMRKTEPRRPRRPSGQNDSICIRPQLGGHQAPRRRITESASLCMDSEATSAAPSTLA